MNFNNQETPSEIVKQSPGCDPKASKRNSGLFAFFKWLKPFTSRESLDTDVPNSHSSSCDSLTSIQSVGTVASFSYVSPSEYKKHVIEKNITPGPETDTYKARLKQRDKRRENDKNVTLRKKYNLFFNRETSVKPSPKQDESTKSLPLMTRANMEQASEQEIHIHRRTNSESSKIKKAGAYLHVKGKRKAPQPPADKQVEENISTASLRRRKRIAPPPPPNPDSKEDLKREKKHLVKTNKYDTIEYADADIIFNDSLKLDHGILKPAKETDVFQSTNDQNNTNVENSPNTSARSSNVETPVSPRPWYKRNISRESKHNTQKDTNVKTAHEYESIERVSEVQYNRNSTIDLTIDEIKIEKKKEEKRKSGLSLLANISELDREASEILNREKQIGDYNIGELPEFMRPKGELPKLNVDNFVSPKRRSSAKDLIAKFNAITNVTKVTVNTALFGGAGKDNGKKDYFGKRSVQENKKQETLLESHKKRIEMIDNKLHDDNKFKLPLMKSESASAIKKPETPKTDRKSWNCPKCYIENDYWRIICHVCSAIKPYFDDLTSNASPKKSCEKLPIIPKQETNNTNFERVLERSKTQIGFSALASYNANQNRNKLEKSVSADDRTEKILDKKVEREKLKKMLIEMKNSLPKRHMHAAKADSRASVIVENPEPGENIPNTKEPADPVTELKSEVKNYLNEEKVVEIVIGTSETIYENIKVKKTEEQKPIKVSSAAQTSSIIKRTEMPVNIAAVLKKKNTFEPMKAKDFEDIYEDNNGGKSSAAKIYANLVQNDELSLFFNMPKHFAGIKNNFNNNSDTIEINRLLRRLEVAIAKGDLTEASLFAKELAQLKVNCSVIRQKPSGSGGTETVKNGFSVDMFVEDKISHRGPFPIHVIENQTVAQLKKQVEKEFGIPTNVQRWILGKELATEDNATLKDNNITTEGCPIFLYLVAPENNHSIGKRKSIIENTDKIKEPDKEITNMRKESPEHTTEKVNEACEATCAVKVHSDDKDSKNATTNGSSRLYEAITLNTPSVYAPKIINVIPKVIESTSKLQACLKENGIFNSQTQKNIKKNDEQEIPKAEKIQQVASTSNVYNSNNFNELVTITVPVVVNLTEIETNHGETKEDNKTVVGKEAKRAETAKEDLKIGLFEEDFDLYDTKTLRPQAYEWECHLCTLLNPLNSNICAVCATIRQKQPKKKLIKRKAPQPTATPITENHDEQTYLQLVNLDNSDLVSTVDVFECLICFVETAPNEGATLRDCLHQFCKECLRNTIEYSIDAEVKCPYRDDQYSCNTALQDREIKSLVTPEVYDQFLARSIAEAENKIGKSFHCKTPDCKGWCIFEDNVNDFRCPVCRKTNCLTCQAIHMGLNCKQFQDRMDAGSETDENAKRTKAMLEEMVNKGEALTCPTCQVIMMKKWGCDWLRCSMCKTEICWVTRGPRWGPTGKGDTSGGCRCGVNGVKCHPKCNYCH